jgi:hypothetical protein
MSELETASLDPKPRHVIPSDKDELWFETFDDMMLELPPFTTMTAHC